MTKLELPANVLKADPYCSFKFRVKWGGKYVAAASEIKGLDGSDKLTDVQANNVGTHRLAHPDQYSPITLERGVSYDNAFEKWASTLSLDADLNNTSPDFLNYLNDLCQDIILEQYNEAGQKVIAYKVLKCWASDYQALSSLESNDNAVAIQSVTFENEGWVEVS